MDAVVLLTAVLLLNDGSTQAATWAKPSMEACQVDKQGLDAAIALDAEAGKIAGGVSVCYNENIATVTDAPKE